MAPAEPCRKQSLPFVDDNLDILVSLLGDGEFDVDVDSDFESIFEMWGSEEQEQIHPVAVEQPAFQSQLVCALLPRCQLQPSRPLQSCCREVASSSVTVFKSPSVASTASKQSLYRQSAISRWLVKRKRRVFVKKVPSTSAPPSNKVVPNRSGSNGRFVKSTRGFISITQAQPSVAECDDELFYQGCNGYE